MAVLASVPGIEVTIWCNGSQLQEYPNDSRDGIEPAVEHKTVTKYVESTADAEFSIKFAVTPPFELGSKYLGFFITLDGETDNVGNLCSQLDLGENGEWNFELRGLETVYEECATERTFKFSKLLLTEENISCMSKHAIKAMQKVGLIEIKVFRLNKGRTIKYKPSKLKGYKEIPEKVIKGQSISHAIAFGDERVLSQPSIFLDNAPALGQNDYIAMFRFKYRSQGGSFSCSFVNRTTLIQVYLDDLQRDMIIPRARSLELAAPRAINTLTVDEKRRLARMKFEDMEMLRSLTGSSVGLSDGHTFDDLDDNEINVLAKEKYAQMMGNTIFKSESIIKQEMVNQAFQEMRPCRNPIAPPYKVIEISCGRTAIDLDDESDTVHLKSAQGYISAQANRGKTRDASSLSMSDGEDDIYVVESRPVKKGKVLKTSSISAKTK